MKLLNDSDGFLMDYIRQMYAAKNFKHCFTILTQSIETLGFDGVIYSYVPFSFTQKPIIYQSESYGDSYLQAYQDNNLFANDHVVKAAIYGEKTWLNWFDTNILEALNSNEMSVIDTTKKFGINNGISFRTFLSSHAYAGVSIICRKDDAYFQAVCMKNREMLELVVQHFYAKISSNNDNQTRFILPLIPKLSKTKQQTLKGLSQGINIKKISSSLNVSEKYIQNLVGDIRQEFNCQTRDELMYTLGILGL